MQDEKKTWILNLYGGPGIGKTTTAMYLCYLLKTQYCDVELVREYIKNWVWDGRALRPSDQLYILAKQNRREDIICGKVDFIVTDAPLMLNAFYIRKHAPQSFKGSLEETALKIIADAEARGHHHHHILLKRSKDYDPNGRFQTEDEACKMDDEIEGILNEYGVPYSIVDTDEEAVKAHLREIFDTRRDNFRIKRDKPVY